MKTLPRLFALLSLFAICPLADAQLAVGNICPVQRANSKLGDIDYDITGTTAPVNVALQISADGGSTWAVPATALTGAIGDIVTPGSNLRITWDSGADWNQRISSQMKFRLSVAETAVVPTGFSLIPAGSYTMGDVADHNQDGDAPAHTVSVSAFYMAKNLVTKADWDTIRTWALSNGYNDLVAGSGKADTHPVQTVSWYQMVKYCNARSQKEGLTPVYYTNDAQTTVYKTGNVGMTNPRVKWTANGYRLPTEAEWEKAARGGLSGKRFPWGDTIGHTKANFYNTGSQSYQTGTTGYHPTYATGSMPYTSPVGSFAANGYGLYDMAGNVCQWCWDWSEDYDTASPTDPHGQNSGAYRVARGGSWETEDSGSVGSRDFSGGIPSESYWHFGFRVARSLVTNSAKADSANVIWDTRDAAPTVTTAPVASAITYGQTLASSTLSGGVGSVPGSFAFTTPSTKPNAGVAPQEYTFTPTDSTNYSAATGAVSVTVNKATLTIITPPVASAITYGQTLASSTLSGGVGSVPGTFAFTTLSTAPALGAALQEYTFTPTDSTNYNAVTGSVSVTVNKATATVALGSLAQTYNGSAKSATSTTSPSGLSVTYTYNGSATAPTTAGNYTVVGTIGDTNYTGSATGTLVISKATPTVTKAPVASAIAYGQTLASSTLSEGVGSVPGSFAFTVPSTAPAAGTASQGYTFTPTDLANYNAVTGMVSVTVNKATPTILTAPVASPIEYGQTLASSTLSGGVASVQGSFALTMPVAGTGLQGYTFSPTDLTNYNTVTGTVSVAVKPLSSRVGEQIQLDFTKFGVSGTMNLVGALPTGLTFISKTGILGGKITGKAGNYPLKLQFLSGKTVLSSIDLKLIVGAYPSGLVGTFKGLLKANGSGRPEGMVSVIVTAPGTWSASLDLARSSKVLSAKGNFWLDPTKAAVDLTIPFPPEMTVHLRLDPSSALVNGDYPQGIVEGFRMASGSELPTRNQLFTLTIDQGTQDDMTIPAGMGWATGTVSNKGAIALTGQLGDGKAFKIATQLSATGQAIVWLKPYSKLNSFVGGIVSLRDRGLVKNGSDAPLTEGLWWYRVADSKELSYPNGFGPLQVDAGIAPYAVPANAAALATSLGLSTTTFPNVIIDGGGLSDSITASLPTSMTLDTSFKLNAVKKVGQTLLPWSGTVNKANGSFSGTLTLPTSTSTSDVLAGAATVSGVLLEGSYYSPYVGSGLIKIPLKSPKGSFRTAAMVTSKETP